MSTFIRLLSYLKPYRWRIALGFLFLIGSICLELTPPLIWKNIVDVAITHRAVNQIWGAVIALTVIQAGQVLLSALRTKLLESVGQHFVYDLRNALYNKLSHQSLSYFNDTRTGDLMSRMSSDVDAVQDVVIQGTDSVVANFLRLAGVAVIFCSLNLKLGLATLLPILIVGVLLKRFNGKIKGIYRAARAGLGAVNAKLQDNLSGIRVIKAFAREDAEEESFQGVSHKYLEENIRAVRLRSTFFPFVRWIAGFGNTITIGYGAWLILHNQFTVGGLVAYRGYGRYFFGPIDDLTQINDTVQRAIAAGNRLFEVLDAPVMVTDSKDALDIPPIEGDIKFERVGFRYHDEGRTILNNLSFHLQPGQTAALVGESGTGKSTILSLVSRFWDPTEGCILIDGHDLRDVTQKSLRSQIASVQQETFLFAASVMDNIRYARPDASLKEVEAAARAANAHVFIQQLPEGYETIVGERGIKLSGGQRQRISIARAFLANPRILLLDEATSAVEPESEQIIQEAIERLMQGRTTLVAAHRLSTIRKADVIFVFRNGRLVEQGRHNDLMQLGGAYCRMVEQQLGISNDVSDDTLPSLAYTQR